MSNTVVIRGETSFAKLLGDPVGNKFDDTKNWTVDVKISEQTEKDLVKLGLKDKVKRKDTYLDGAPHVTFKHPEYRFDGVTKNDPIPVKDILGKAWDDSKLIGNGSVADFKFVSPDPKPGRKRGMYLRSVRILKHESFEREEFGGLNKNDEFYTAMVEAEKAAKEQAEKMVPFETDKLDDDFDDAI